MTLGSFAGLLVLFVLMNTLKEALHANEVREEVLKGEQQVAGRYQLDTTKSWLNGYDAIDYYRLSIVLKADKTFSFSENVPFLPGTMGTWEYIRGSEGDYNQFVFTDVAMQDNEFLKFSLNGNQASLAIYSPEPKNGRPKAGLLYFIRKP